jgi:hypothetical protein
MIATGVALLALLAYAWRGELLPRAAIVNQR